MRKRFDQLLSQLRNKVDKLQYAMTAGGFRRLCVKIDRLSRQINLSLSEERQPPFGLREEVSGVFREAAFTIKFALIDRPLDQGLKDQALAISRNLDSRADEVRGLYLHACVSRPLG